MVLSTGAGVAVPFAWVARLRGASVVYVESLARIEGPSLTYRLIAPIASRRYVPVARARGRASGHALRRQRLLGGHVIFVSVGTNEAASTGSYERWPGCRAGRSGSFSTATPPRSPAPVSSWSTFSPSTRWPTAIRRCRVFVTHAGVGSVIVALANGKRAVVVPRRKAFGEAVDDHQLQLGRRFAAAGLVTLVEETEALAGALAQGEHDVTVTPSASALAADLRGYLEAAVGHTAVPARA